VCKDGFRSGTLSVPEFTSLCHRIDVRLAFVDVDASSVFCEITA
jgi:hypothetical protein